MKKFLLASFFISFACTGSAQMYHTFPPEAADFYNRVIQKIKPEIAAYISNTAAVLKDNSVNSDSLCHEMKKMRSFKNIDEEGCKTIALLILVRCSMNADAALKQIVLKLQQSDEGEKNPQATEDLLNRKSNLAAQIKSLLAKINDENIALKDLR